MAHQVDAVKFQFLIGSLKTANKSPLVNDFPKFQFLIGSLKTFYPRHMWSDGEGFQFLIGSLKTEIQGRQSDGRNSFNSS